jgi:hypothetical protein
LARSSFGWFTRIASSKISKNNFRTGTGDWPKLEPGAKDLQLELDMPKTWFYPSFCSKILKLKENFNTFLAFPVGIKHVRNLRGKN